MSLRASMIGENIASDRKSQPTMSDFRALVFDLYAHKPQIYWPDMLLSAALGWSGLIFAATRARFDWLLVVAVLISAFAFLRAVLFIHELSHFRKGVLPGFSLIWNLVVGLPLLAPSFMYVGTHTDHHKRTLYGTINDPEYLPLGHFGRARIVRFLLEMLVVPLLLVLRYGVLTPLSWLIPPLRRVVVAKMSALVVNPEYQRKAPKGSAKNYWIFLETLIFAWLAMVVTMLVTGRWTTQVVYVWYAMSALLALINQVRTLTAHLYQNDGGEISTIDQLLDSCNVKGIPLLTEMVYPVGLRHHALHHLLADMPYHNLGQAHRRLLAKLPEDSPYCRTNYSGTWAIIKELWRSAGASDGEPSRWKKEKNQGV